MWSLGKEKEKKRGGKAWKIVQNKGSIMSKLPYLYLGALGLQVVAREVEFLEHGVAADGLRT